MQRFVHNQNLLHFVELLERETDGPKRDLLQRLLLDEENRFGERRERLEQTDSLIARGRERIRRQREILSQFSDGAAAEMAQITLINLMRTQSLFEAFRQVMLDGHDTGPTD